MSTSAGTAAAAPGGTPRVLVTPRSLTLTGLDAVAELAPLREQGLQVISGPPGRTPTEAELLALVPGCVGWLAGVERISARVLESAAVLRVISRNGSGTDSVDMVAAERLGIRVTRADGANAQGVAELTLALALSALRHLPWSSATMRAGGWQRWEGRELADCTVGIVGLGAIGRRASTLFLGLGAEVIAHDPFVAAATAPVPMVGLDELLGRCDVVTLHCPPLADGRPLLDAERLTRAAPGAVLVNTARAALVDDDAVLTALEDGTLSAYAVDAFESEPPELTPLLVHERVIATPHIGGYTGASVRRATSQAVTNLLDALGMV
jgi:D-3-phosphoglycerate dehydrogenase / 2-oxoglutarate reductase